MKTLRILPLLLVAGCASVNPNVVQDVQVGINAAVCVITTATADVAQGESAAAVVSDVVAKCGVSVAQVATIFDAQAAANINGLTSAQIQSLSTAAHAAH